MEPKDQIRRFLEQRRELGESEFVLDSLGVDEVMRLLGAREGANAAPRGVPAPDSAGGRTPGGAERERPTRPVAEDRPSRQVSDDRPGRSDEQPRLRAGGEAGQGGDWRAALSAVGAGPGPAAGDTGATSPGAPPRSQDVPPTREPRHQSSAPTTGTTPQPSVELIPLDQIPQGLVVGSGPLALPQHVASCASLDLLAEEIARCTRCELYATAKRHVPGAGNPNADFVCVGEAPGANEDEQGVPFVGQAGQLLTKILAAIDLSRDDVFICNVLKHRPPGNRNPEPAEIAACSPFLLRQLELLRPKVLLALGTFAAQTLLQTKEPIGKLRGRIHRYHGVPVVVTYHPAALLRNPAWKRPTWEDVQLARRLLERPEPGT